MKINPVICGAGKLRLHIHRHTLGEDEHEYCSFVAAQLSEMYRLKTRNNMVAGIAAMDSPCLGERCMFRLRERKSV